MLMCNNLFFQFQGQIGAREAEPVQGRRALLHVLHKRRGRLAISRRCRAVSLIYFLFKFR